jgi:alkaline phosphatase D
MITKLNKQFIAIFISILFACNAIANTCIYKWCGAVTENSVAINFKLQQASNNLVVKIDTNTQFTTAMISTSLLPDTSNNNIYKTEFNQLKSHTQYYYAVFDSGMMIPNSQGSFKTTSYLPHSFRFAFGSCSTSVAHPVYNVIDSLHPDFMLFTGDLHYYDPNSININAHRLPYEITLKQPSISTLLQHTPIAYVWDDHDFTCNNCDGTSIGKLSAYTSYQQIVPHYPLSNTGIDVAIYQSFDYGRVHFILSDLRSERINGINIMNPQQMQWLKNEFLYAKHHHQMSVWISSVSYNGNNQADNWAEFISERTELSNFWRDSSIANVLILAGDAHMLAIDNGTNNHYETDSINPHQYPIFQAAALNRAGSIKGGTFSEGTFPNPIYNSGQFGLVDVIDNGGDSICFELNGYRTDSLGANTNVVVSYHFCRDLIHDIITDQQPNKFDNHLFSTFMVGDLFQIKNLSSDSAITIDITDARGRVIQKQLSISPSSIVELHNINAHGMLLIKAHTLTKSETRKITF